MDGTCGEMGGVCECVVWGEEDDDEEEEEEEEGEEEGDKEEKVAESECCLNRFV